MNIITPATQKVSDSLDDTIDDEEVIGCGSQIISISNPIEDEM